MLEKNKNCSKEAETICVLSMLVINLLLLIVVGEAFWAVYILLENANFLDAFAFGHFML